MIRLQSKKFFESEKFLFYISTHTIKSNEKVDLHSHEFFELVYVIEGGGEHIYNGSVYPLKEGDVFIIEPERIHGYKVGKYKNLKVFNILFQLSLLKKEIESLFDLNSFLSFFYLEPFLRDHAHFKDHLVLNYREQTEISMLLQKIVQEYNEKELGYMTLIKTRMLELFIFLSRCYDTRINPLKLKADDHTKAIDQICKFINTYYDTHLSLDQVSKLSGMSKSSFTAKFKHTVGKTFIEYLNVIRIKASKELLIYTNEKIIYIANKVGFDDVSYFNRTFKQFTKMSPSHFRKEYKSNLSK